MRKVMDIANVTVTVLVGAYLVLLSASGYEGFKAVPEVIADSGLWIVFFLIGAFLVYVNVRELYRELKTHGLRSNLRITTEQGMTEFSVPSLEMLLLRDLKAEPDVVDPIVTLEPRAEGKPMRCEVQLKLRRQEDVIKRIDSLKRKVRDIIDRLIPGGLTVEVFVEVRDIVNESLRSRRDIAGGEFNGPVYVDGGGSEGV